MAPKQSKEKDSTPEPLTWSPPADHALFGEGRALYGLATRGGGLVRNPQLPDMPFQKHGDNDIELGIWFYHLRQMSCAAPMANIGRAFLATHTTEYLQFAWWQEAGTFPSPIPEPYTRYKAGDDSKGRSHKDYRPQTTSLRRNSHRVFKAEPDRKDLKGSVRVSREVTVYAKTTVSRYDGLYDVVDKDEEYFLGNDNYLHPCFRLQRRAGQA